MADAHPAFILKSREMYFGIYQALAEDERRVGLFRSFPPDFFDLVIVDECHRWSARDESSWRVVLDYFQPAAQLGMTATPLREETRDTYLNFGDPIYQYSLRQGIVNLHTIVRLPNGVFALKQIRSTLSSELRSRTPPTIRSTASPSPSAGTPAP